MQASVQSKKKTTPLHMLQVLFDQSSGDLCHPGPTATANTSPPRRPSSPLTGVPHPRHDQHPVLKRAQDRRGAAEVSARVGPVVVNLLKLLEAVRGGARSPLGRRQVLVVQHGTVGQHRRHALLEELSASEREHARGAQGGHEAQQGGCTGEQAYSLGF